MSQVIPENVSQIRQGTFHTLLYQFFSSSQPGSYQYSTFFFIQVPLFFFFLFCQTKWCDKAQEEKENGGRQRDQRKRRPAEKEEKENEARRIVRPCTDHIGTNPEFVLKRSPTRKQCHHPSTKTRLKSMPKWMLSWFATLPASQEAAMFSDITVVSFWNV